MDPWIQISTTFCITTEGTCPPTVINWSLTLIIMALTAAIAAYKAFKIWINRPQPVFLRDFDSEYDSD